MGFMTSRWRKHVWVLTGLLLLVVGLDALVWLHPKLGYVQGGIINGADLRRDVIQLSIWLTLVFSAASTMTIRWLRSVSRDGIVFLSAYAAGAVCSAVAIPILDKFY